MSRAGDEAVEAIRVSSTPSGPASVPRERLVALAAVETAQGRDPEFDRIALIGSPAD